MPAVRVARGARVRGWLAALRALVAPPADLSRRSWVAAVAARRPDADRALDVAPWPGPLTLDGPTAAERAEVDRG